MPTVLDRIVALADQSLVRRVEGPPGSARWSMLETIREFGLEQLAASGEEPTVRDQHLAWCIAAVEAAWPPRSAAPPQDEVLLQLDAERANLRAALAWAIESEETDAALRLTGGLAVYWILRGDLTEGRAWTERALALPGGAPALRATTLWAAGALPGYQGDHAVGRERAAQSLEVAAAIGDWAAVVAARNLTSDMFDGADSVAQARYAEETLVLARCAGNPGSLGYALTIAGYFASVLGDIARAVSLYEEALRLFTAMGDRLGEVNAIRFLAPARLDLGALDDAERLYRRGGALARHTGNRWGLVSIVVGLARLTAERGEPESAARMIGFADGLGEPMGLTHTATDPLWRIQAEARTRDQLAPDAFAAAWEAGRTLARDRSGVAALDFAADLGSILPAPATGESDVAFALSPREREVLALLAQRHTDPEIADALSLSPRTVEGHVRGIFNKLSVSNRRDARALAARNGLV